MAPASSRVYGGGVDKNRKRVGGSPKKGFRATWAIPQKCPKQRPQSKKPLVDTVVCPKRAETMLGVLKTPAA
eukprot:11201674-Lingulodinium_polyedra.AAC.1